MEYVEGKALSDLLLTGPLPADQVVRIGSQVAGALAEAHRHGIIHRDIKSENIMVTAAGRARVLDFGLAKWVGTRGVGSDALTQEGLVVGTARAMSPEQALGKPTDHRSDIFSLGSLLYELLTGSPAFRGETPMDTMVKVARLECPPLRERAPGLPAELVAVVERCMARRPEDRYQSAEDVAQSLERLSGTQGSRPPVPTGFLGNRRAVAAVAVTVLLAVLVGALTGRLADRLRRPGVAVAVLPLEGRFAGDEGRLAAEAVADAITTHLSRLEKVHVVSGREVRAVAKREGIRLAEIAAELGVSELVDTAVTQERTGAPARVTLSRLDGSTGRVLWSQELEVATEDLLLLQDRVTLAVTDAYQGYALDERVIERQVTPAALAAYLEVTHRSATGSSSAGYEHEIRLLEEALQQSPTFLEAAMRLATVHDYLFQISGDSGQRDRAEALLARAASLAPGDPRVARARVDHALRSGRPDEAEVEARQLVSRRPGDAEAWSILGEALQRLNRLPEAERALRRANGLRPFWRYQFTLADIQRQSGEFDQARRTLEDLLSRFPHNSHVRGRLAFVLYSAGEIAEAERHYRILTETNGDNLDFNNLGSMLLLLGRYQEAEESLRRAVELAPNRASHRANLAKTLYWADDAAGARREFAVAMEIADGQLAAGVNVAQNRRTRALCLAHLGRGSEAVLEIQRALEASNFDAYTLAIAATVAALNNDYHGALAWTTRAREAGALAILFSGPEFAELRNDPAFAALLAARP